MADSGFDFHTCRRNNMDKTNIIFLDIDGVLHPAGAAYIDDRTGKTMGDRLFRWLEILMCYLNQYPDVKVVIHSTWRICHPTFAELLSELPERLRARVVASTGTEIMGRWDSIQNYLSLNKVDNFIILDDEERAFGRHSESRPKELIACRSRAGLTSPGVQAKLKKALEEMHLI